MRKQMLAAVLTASTFLLAGCGGEQPKDEAMSVGAGTSASDVVTTDAATEETAMTSTAVDSEAGTSAEGNSPNECLEYVPEESSEASQSQIEWNTLPITEDETAAVIDVALAGIKAMRESDAEACVKYTNIDMMWYMTYGSDCDDLVSEVNKAFTESTPSLADYYNYDLEISSVQKTNDVIDRFKAYVKEYESDASGSADLFEHYNISDAYVCNVHAKAGDGEHSDDGFVVVLRENGELKFDMFFSWMMEVAGEWQRGDGNE